MAAMSIGRRLHQARLAAGLSQAVVAARLAIPRNSVSLFESGQRSVSSTELVQLAHLYGQSVGHLLADHDAEPTDAAILLRFRAAGPVEDDTYEVIRCALARYRQYAASRISRIRRPAFRGTVISGPAWTGN